MSAPHICGAGAAATPHPETLTEADIRWALRDACFRAGGVIAFATAHSLGTGQIYDVLNANRPPSPEVCAAIGIRRTVRYERVAP